MTNDDIKKIINPLICDNENTHQKFLDKLKQGELTRDENPQSHCCAYFFPFNKENGKIFIVHHKKSDLWLSPGGHIDKGEKLIETLNREIEEELGVKKFFTKIPSPFLLTITPINNSVQKCKTHYDIWNLMPTDGHNFIVDQKEFHETKWLSIEEARKIVTDPANIKAINTIQKKYL